MAPKIAIIEPRQSLGCRARQASAPRKPREGTKQEQVLALLRRAEGATIAQICDATGWQQHYADVRIMPM